MDMEPCTTFPAAPINITDTNNRCNCRPRGNNMRRPVLHNKLPIMGILPSNKQVRPISTGYLRRSPEHKIYRLPKANNRHKCKRLPNRFNRRPIIILTARPWPRPRQELEESICLCRMVTVSYLPTSPSSCV